MPKNIFNDPEKANSEWHIWSKEFYEIKLALLPDRSKINRHLSFISYRDNKGTPIILSWESDNEEEVIDNMLSKVKEILSEKQPA